MIIKLIKLYLKILNFFKIRIRFLDHNNNLYCLLFKKPKYYIYINNYYHITDKFNFSNNQTINTSDLDIDDILYIRIYLQNRFNNDIKYDIIIKNDTVDIFNILKKKLLDQISLFKILSNTTIESYIYPLIYYYIQYYLKINDEIINIEFNYNSTNIKINNNETINDLIIKIK